MNTPMLRAITIASTAAIVMSASAPSLAGNLSLATGLDFTRGFYGNAEQTTTVAAPLVVKYSNGPLVLKASTALVTMSGPGNVIGAGDTAFSTQAAAGARRTVTGYSDLVIGATYTVHERDGWLVDVTGKVKLPTADQGKGLSTGKSDVTALVDIFKSSGPWVYNIGGGYKWVGNPDGASFRNISIFTTGLSSAVSPSMRVGGSYDYAQSVIAGRPPREEIMVYALNKLGAGFKLQTYASAGLNSNSPRAGLGLVVSREF